MKIRTGFVSNSSTTSFTIFGVQTNSKKLNELYELGIDPEYGIGLDCEYGEWDDVYIGLTISADHEHEPYSGVDETRPLKEQKEEVEKKLIKYFGEEYVKENLGTYSESWFNG